MSLPENHDLAKTWPAVFYYHGTGGRPGTSLIRGHTGDDDWIVVGMGYRKRGTFQLTPAGMDAEVAVLKEVRTILQKRANLDPSQVYVSGFSKGGWVSGLLLQKERSLAGAAILGAGHLHQLETVPKPFKEGTPVFVGVGRLDQNYPFALKALVFYRKLGAQVELETWQGLGHAFPKAGSTGLKEWLALRLGRTGDEEELRVELSEILERKDDYQRWWNLEEFVDRPFVKAHPEVEAEVKAAILQQQELPAIAREARILKESRRLLGLEIGKKTLPMLEEIVAGYARIAEAAKESPQGELAAQDYERTSVILDLAREQFAKQERERKETPVRPPTERRTRPVNPLVR